MQRRRVLPSNDTIAAIATPPGRGGVGIIRISGPNVASIAQPLLGFLPKARVAEYCVFRDQNDIAIDKGLVLFFPNPHSFTGEDVLELHGHGGPVVQDCLLRRILELGARIARPGEFSERAFLNDKLDLAQAEAIADLIDATSEQAARAAMRSLQGEFSKQIQRLVTALIHLRIYVEAAIDFPEEEVDFLTHGKVHEQLVALLQELKNIQTTARQGSLLREGMTVVIAGAPNAGKSSLLNALSGRDVAIVTNIPGTTRDVLRDAIQIDGLPLHIIDTAGLRDSSDHIEQEGIRRALHEIEHADQVLLVVDGMEFSDVETLLSTTDLLRTKITAEKSNITIVRNKIDLLNQPPSLQQENGINVISLSAKAGTGMALLREHLKSCMGYTGFAEGGFTARRRHLDALARAEQAMLHAQTHSRAGELLAEDLRQAQSALNEITGEFTSDDLLGKIFASFCIGK